MRSQDKACSRAGITAAVLGGSVRAHGLAGTSGSHGARTGQRPGRRVSSAECLFPCLPGQRWTPVSCQSAYESHAVLPLTLRLSPRRCNMCVCATTCVCVWRLAKKLTVYHVALQAARCPCTGHPHRKSIHKNRDYI